MTPTEALKLLVSTEMKPFTGMDWEAYDIPGMTLVGKKLPNGSIAFLRLTQQETNNFVNERTHESSDKFEQFIGLQIFETPGNDKGIQEIPGRETIERSIHHNKQPSP